MTAVLRVTLTDGRTGHVNITDQEGVAVAQAAVEAWLTRRGGIVAFNNVSINLAHVVSLHLEVQQ